MALLEPDTISLFPDTPLYTMRVSMNGVDYTLRFDYSQREDRWYLSLYAIDGSLIRSGVKIVPSVPGVLRLFRHDARTPKGLLMFADPTSTEAEAPGFSALGRRVILLYFAHIPEPAPIGVAIYTE